MEWVQRLNAAIDYVEVHLEEELNYEAAAQIACCSVFHFQRMFAYLAGVPLSEYIRRRRMTKAAFDLQAGGQKVIDVALKYGYQSPTAFNRAFQGVHGITPSEAKKEGAVLKSYQPLSFKITVQGVEEMDYRIISKEAITIVGVSAPMSGDIEENFSIVPDLWAKAANEDILPRLVGIMNQEPMGVLGVSIGFGDQWRYCIAVASDVPAPEGLESYTIGAGTWAVFSGSGSMPVAVQELEKKIVTQWLPTSGYEYDERPDVEVYLNADPSDAQFEVWIPVIKK